MKSKKKFMILWVLLIAVLFAGSLLTAPPGKTETIQTAMRDAVLHEENQISLFGWKNVNPGRLQAKQLKQCPHEDIRACAEDVGPQKSVSLRTAGSGHAVKQAYGLLQQQLEPPRHQLEFRDDKHADTRRRYQQDGGYRVTLPAPLSDVNGAIALGCLSYLVILSGGIAGAASEEEAARAGTVRDSTTSRTRNNAGILFFSSFILITSR